MVENLFREQIWSKERTTLTKVYFLHSSFHLKKKQTNKNYELLQGKPKVKGNPETDAIDTKGYRRTEIDNSKKGNTRIKRGNRYSHRNQTRAEGCAASWGDNKTQ